MAPYVPVELTNGVDTVIAETAGDFTQYIWDGWVPTSAEYQPPLPDGSPGPVVPTVADFMTMMDDLYVRKDDLVIAPEPPATPKGPGTVHIDNSVN